MRPWRLVRQACAAQTLHPSPISRVQPGRWVAVRSRTLSTTSAWTRQDPERHPHPQRDAQQDRNKINAEANEYAKSGTDHAASANEEAAFDPEITDPQEAKDKAGEGNRVNPLDASPANPELSKGTEEEQGGLKKKTSEGGGGRQGGGEAGKREQSV